MSPGTCLKDFLIKYIESNNLEDSLIKEIPRKWEKYGDFVLFDERTFANEIWKNQGNNLWLNIAKILQCKRIGLKNKIQNNDYRSPNVTLILGNDPWTLHKDNSIIFSWNITKSMFSAGNISEKLRVANMNCLGEIVVDLFAGIGYFTLPFLIHAKAAHVHACEWNPDAVEALKNNLKLNKVDDKCTVYEGDSILLCPKKIANRVNLGLIPTSESHWKTACESLVDAGGILHIHENVETKKSEIKCESCQKLFIEIGNNEEVRNIYIKTNETCIRQGSILVSWKHKQWLIKAIHILHSLKEILLHLDNSKVWFCSIETVCYVKSYAPHVNHLVYDVKISQ